MTNYSALYTFHIHDIAVIYYYSCEKLKGKLKKVKGTTTLRVLECAELPKQFNIIIEIEEGMSK